jgi:hypothetical protein
MMATGPISGIVPVYAIGDSPTDVGREGARAEVRKPDGTSAPVSERDGVLNSDTKFDEPGLYRITTAGKSRFIALRTPVSESETALAEPALIQRLFARDPSSPQAPATHTIAVPAGESRWWRILVALGFVLLCIEGVIAVAKRRRVPEEVSAAIG